MCVADTKRVACCRSSGRGATKRACWRWPRRSRRPPRSTPRQRLASAAEWLRARAGSLGEASSGATAPRATGRARRLGGCARALACVGARVRMCCACVRTCVRVGARVNLLMRPSWRSCNKSIFSPGQGWHRRANAQKSYKSAPLVVSGWVCDGKCIKLICPRAVFGSSLPIAQITDGHASFRRE